MIIGPNMVKFDFLLWPNSFETRFARDCKVSPALHISGEKPAYLLVEKICRGRG